ncbi:MAG: glycosyltransferase [Cyclobacteriaceae bacterium]
MGAPKYSVIVPVYNRPEELEELLHTLCDQTHGDFEVIVVEDGSTVKADDVVKQFPNLDIAYYFKENEGQGFARNYGFEKAKGEFLLVFDSDVLLPNHYFDSLDSFLANNEIDAFGGPDAAHPSFTNIQKAISHSMTSFLTTGGIRGKKQHVGQFHPRSFNMGMRRTVYETIGGYKIPFMGEDMELSTRLIESGFKTALIEHAFVYHKRRTSFIKFFEQLKYFGRARINITRFFPDQLKLVHLFPTFFTFGIIAAILMLLLIPAAGMIMVGFYSLYFLVISIEAGIKYKSIGVALLAPIAAFLQLTGYGLGLVYEWMRKLIGIDPNTPYTKLY